MVMLVNSALRLTETTFDLKNVLMNAEINIKINKSFNCSSC